MPDTAPRRRKRRPLALTQACSGSGDASPGVAEAVRLPPFGTENRSSQIVCRRTMARPAVGGSVTASATFPAPPGDFTSPGSSRKPISPPDFSVRFLNGVGRWIRVGRSSAVDGRPTADVLRRQQPRRRDAAFGTGPRSGTVSFQDESRPSSFRVWFGRCPASFGLVEVIPRPFARRCLPCRQWFLVRIP